MLVGKRIQIRAVEYEDLPLMVKWRNDPQVYQFFYEHEPLSMIAQKAWFNRLLQKPNERLWITERVEDGQVIGMVGLTHIDWRNRRSELSRVLIIDEYRGRGLGSELICLTLRYFFDHLNMNRLYCDTFLENENAVAFYKRLGFRQEGVFRQHVFKEGRYRDVVYLAMLREDYRSAETQARIREYLD